jgi:hypothetical protein
MYYQQFYSKSAFLFLISLLSNFYFSQDLTQTIRGKVIDQDSKFQAIGATVIILDSDPLVGTVTDINGYYKIENVPVGRISLKVSYTGYESRTIPNVVVGSGKETIVNVEIIESIESLESVTILAEKNKTEALNEMSQVSARVISMDDTKRFAGTVNDPSRMVSSYAGVNSDASGNNDIIVRGNSPKGILWRMEGVEIPNPNHFAEEGSTGGSISALNSVMLANSDFSTGAFAPEYGNALSGVMDMKLRIGNNEKREYTFGIGVLGTDMTIEGPFKAGSNSSYVANYRYSSLALLDNAGIVDFGGVPKYQDGAFKLYFPTKKLGVISVFGLGGISTIAEKDTFSLDATKYKYEENFNAYMGIVGLSNVVFLNDKTSLNSKVSLASNGSNYNNKLWEDGPLVEDYEDNLTKTSLRFSSTLNKKINSKNKFVVGAILTQQQFTFFSEDYNFEQNKEVRDLDQKGSLMYLQGYASWKHRLNENITIIGGMHYLQMTLNNSFSIEPRASVKWNLAKKHTLTAGFGIHSKTESLLSYFARIEQPDGSFKTPNTGLDLTKANHYVIGYDYSLGKNTHIKIEGYFQKLYNVPVSSDTSVLYSTINSSDWYNNIPLNNDGTGENIGVELTLERFFSKGFYYLFSGSIYNATYSLSDGVKRDSKYNGNYTANFLIGKEFTFGKTKNKLLNLSTKISYTGGNRYTPLDLQTSQEKGYGVYFRNRPYGAKGEDVFVLNVGGSLQVNRKKVAHILKIEVLNATNNQAKLIGYYNAKTNGIDYDTQLEIIPNIIYQIQF